MDMTKVLKGFSLVTALAFVLPAYTVEKDDEKEEAVKEAKIHVTATLGGFAFSIVDKKADDPNAGQKVTLKTNLVVKKKFFEVSGKKFSFCFFKEKGDIKASGSSDLFNVAGMTLSLKPAFDAFLAKEDCTNNDFKNMLATTVGLKIKDIEDSKEKAQQKALAYKKELEDQKKAEEEAKLKALAEAKAAKEKVLKDKADAAKKAAVANAKAAEEKADKDKALAEKLAKKKEAAEKKAAEKEDESEEEKEELPELEEVVKEELEEKVNDKKDDDKK